MSSEQYWRNQVAQTEAEYEQVIQGLRDEVEKQRRRCSELMHEQAMQRATAAIDVRNFCTQYVADAKQQRAPSTSAAAAAAAPAHSASNNKGVESIPLPALLGFLHEYSHGLLQLPENRRKRDRGDVVLNPVHHRLRQRMLARHRMTGRDDDVLDDGEGHDGASQVGSPSSPPMGPSAGRLAYPRFPNAAAAARAEAYADPAELDVAAVSNAASAADNHNLRGGDSVKEARRTGGDGGTLMSASAFGLPTLPSRS